MTDKEKIIINEVDVESCKHYISKAVGREYDCKLGRYCKLNSNCYYKQLQRKEQECEKWKEKWNIGFQKFCDKDNELQHYKQALNEIAEHYEKVIKNLTTYDDSYDANISIKALHNISDIINKAKDSKQ